MHVHHVLLQPIIVEHLINRKPLKINFPLFLPKQIRVPQEKEKEKERKDMHIIIKTLSNVFVHTSKFVLAKSADLRRIYNGGTLYIGASMDITQ